MIFGGRLGQYRYYNMDQVLHAAYPINNQRNNELYKQYAKLASEEANNVIFGGRLGQYRYYNMDQVLHAALTAVNKEFD